MSNFNSDILIGFMFVAGIFGFVSGEFVFSTMLFAVAAIVSNVSMTKQISR
ncbi:MAG: hypothetical protein ABL925_14740 [Methylococcales bacterium]